MILFLPPKLSFDRKAMIDMEDDKTLALLLTNSWKAIAHASSPLLCPPRCYAHPRHALLRRPLWRRFQLLRPKHLGGRAGGGRLGECGQRGARRRDGGWGGAEFRSPPALHLQQDVRAICLDPRRRRPHQWRAGDAGPAPPAVFPRPGGGS